MDRRRFAPRRRSARVLVVAALSGLCFAALPHGGALLSPLPVLAHKPVPPTPAPTAAPTPAPTPPPPAETPAPASKAPSTPAPEHHDATAIREHRATPPPAPVAALTVTPTPAPPPPPHTPRPAHLVQRVAPASAAVTATAAGVRAGGAASPLVIGADALAGVAVAGSLALAELRRRRLV